MAVTGPCPLWRLAALAVVAVIAALPLPALAQAIPENNALDAIVNLYLGSASGWYGYLQRAALGLFWILAGIELAWTGIALAIRGAALGEFLQELVQRVLYIGFFLWLLTNSQSLAQDIIISLSVAADTATLDAGGRAGTSPGDVFDSGVTLASTIWDRLSLLEPGLSLALSISGLIVLVVFCLLAAMITLATIEAAIVMNAGVIILGLGGARWTRGIAQKYLLYALSVGIKLFIIQLLVGLGEALITGWAASATFSVKQVLVMIGASIVLLALTWSIPSILQGVISGAAFGAGGQAMSATGAVASAGALAASGMIGGGLAVREAGLLAAARGGGSSGGDGAGQGAGSGGGVAEALRAGSGRGGGLPEANGVGNSGENGSSPASGDGPGLSAPAGAAQSASEGGGAKSGGDLGAAASGAGSIARSAASVAGGTVIALAGAAARDIGARATGARRSGVGVMPGRMAADLRERRIGAASPALSPLDDGPVARSGTGDRGEPGYPSPAADLTRESGDPT